MMRSQDCVPTLGLLKIVLMALRNCWQAPQILGIPIEASIQTTMVQGLHLRVRTPRPTALMTVQALSLVRHAVRQIPLSAARPSARSLQSTCSARAMAGRFSISKAGRSCVLRPVQLLEVLHTCAARYVLIIIYLPDQTRSSQLDRLSKRRMSTYST